MEIAMKSCMKLNILCRNFLDNWRFDWGLGGGSSYMQNFVLYFVKYGIVTSAGYLKICQVYMLAHLCFGSEILEWKFQDWHVYITHISHQAGKTKWCWQ